MIGIYLSQINDLTQSERIVGFCGLLALMGYAAWAFIRWFVSKPVQPDPWDEQVARDLAEDNCTPLCHHCLSPHDATVNFCPDCGAAVGACTNWLPYPYLFSIGHTLRIGTNENFKRSPLTVGGFIFFSIVEYSLFAPLYWIRLIGNLHRKEISPPTDSLEGADTTKPAGED